MKKIIALVSLLIVFYSSFGQPIQNRSNAVVTVQDSRWMGQLNMFIPRYNDTTQANSSLGIDSCGAMIFTYTGNNIFYRGCSPKRWLLIGSGSIVNDTIYTRLPIYVDYTSDPPKRIITLLHANGLISGGVVTVDSCMSIDITPPVFVINYITYTGVQTIGVVIQPADPSLPRIDRVVIDTALNIIVIQGTPSSTPIAPPFNTFSQVELAQIPVGAGITCLGDIDIIFDGITDDPAQWDTATSGTISVNFSNTANPYHLNQAAYTVTYTDSSQLIFTKPSGTDTVKATSVLKGFITVIGAFTNQISGQFFLNSTAVSNQLLLNPYFNQNDSGQYQIFAPPLNAWSWSGSEFNKFILTFGGNDVSGAKGLYLDWIQLQSGIGNVNTSGQFVDSTKIIGGNEYYYKQGVPYLAGSVGGTANITDFEWSVRDSLSTPAVLPNEGSIFLVGTSPTGAFVGHANNIATYDSIPATYSFDTASVGDLLYNATTQFVSQLIGGTWVRIGRAVLHQGGDTYASTIVAGARDNFGLNLITRDTARVEISAAGSKFSNSVLNGNFININPTVTGLSPKVTFFYGGASQIDLSTNSGGSRFLTSVGLDVNGKATGVGLISNYINSPNGDAFNTNPAGGSLLLIGMNTPSYINFTNETNFFSGALGTQAATGDLTYYRNPSTNNVFNGTEVFRAVRATGNVLIGTPTDIPISKFTVFDTLRGSIPAPKMSAAQRLTLGNAILTASIGAGGTGYTNGSYSAVALTGGSGTGATANITVSGGGVVTAVTIVNRGKNYTAGNNLSSASIGGGSGFLYNVSSVTGALVSGLQVYDTDTLCVMVYNGSTWNNLCSSGSGGSSITADNGLTMSTATNVQFGGTLVATTELDLDGNDFEIESGGQYQMLIEPVNLRSQFQATDGTNYSLLDLRANTGDGVYFNITAFDGTNTVEIKADAQAKTITNTADTILLNSTLSGTSTGDVWTLADPTTGSGYWGAGGGGGTVLANNGLTKVVDSIKLGGTLTAATTINGSTLYALTLQSAIPSGSGNATLNVNNTSGTGGAILINSDGGVGLEIVANTGYAATFSSNTGPGMSIGSGTNTPIVLTSNPAGTNNTNILIDMQRYSSGTPANGIGGNISYSIETVTGGAAQESNTLVSKWTDATLATRTSEFSITGVNSAVTGTLFSLQGDASAKFFGSVIFPYVAKTTTYPITSSDYTIDCTSGTFTTTLPTAVGIAGRIYVIKNSGAGVITLACTGGQTIDGSATQTLATLVSLTVQSNGSNWIII